MIEGIALASAIIIGASALTIGGPVLGELIATMAPLYASRTPEAALRYGIRYEEIKFPAVDGLTLRGWFFPAEERNAPAIIYAPATSRDQRSGESLVKPLIDAGYHVLLFSYRGHGDSEGNRFGFTYGAEESKDIDAAASFLYRNKSISEIGVIGHSAGAVSSIISAARNPLLKAVVAAAPFPSVEEIWSNNRPEFMPAAFFDFVMRLTEQRKGYSRHQVRPRDVIKQIAPRPVLLIHGCEDQRITRDQALQLYDNAQEPKQLWYFGDASHSAIRSPVLDNIMEDVIDFLDAAFSRNENMDRYSLGIRNCRCTTG